MATSVHPLVLMSISDHLTRDQLTLEAQRHVAGSTGMIFGIQSGLNVEIFSSCEMPLLNVAGRWTIDKKFISQQQLIITQAFPGYELLGWYAATNVLLEEVHKNIHVQMTEFSESPLLLHLLATIEPGAKELPMQLLVSAVDGGPLTTIPFKIETTESERLTIDFITNSSSVGLKNPLAQQISLTAAAVSMLSERLNFLKAYIMAVKCGEVPVDHDLLRMVASVSHHIPAMADPEALVDLNKDYDDFLLTGCLSSIATGTEAALSLHRHAQQAGFGQQRFDRSGGASVNMGAGGLLGGPGGRAEVGRRRRQGPGSGFTGLSSAGVS